MPKSPCLYSDGELTPSSDENSFFKEGGSEDKEPNYKSGITSIVSLGPKKLVANGEQIV